MTEQTNTYQELNSVKGDDIGLFYTIRMCLNDIRDARKNGDTEIYKRTVTGFAMASNFFYDKTTTKKHDELDAKRKAGKISDWQYADELYLLILNTLAACGFIPLRESDGIIEDDDINDKIQQKNS